MTRLSNILMMLTIAVAIVAKPAYREPIDMVQADGTTKQVYLHGDEHYHYMTDADGKWLKWDNGQLVETEAASKSEIQARRQKGRYNAPAEAQVGGGAYLAPRGLVLLVNFSDLEFQEVNTQAAFDSLLNSSDYFYHGEKGCVRNYFEAQSNGTYSPVFDVYGPVTVNHTMSYYGANNDARASYLVRDACNAAKEAYDINFADYDNDGDNKVDFVFIFYAGYGEADGADENTIWQHMYHLSWAGITCNIDGKKVDLYACGSELCYYNRSRASNPRDGINTCCHEFSHVCGLPDMYCTDENNYVYTLGRWDLMDNGTSNNNGWTPPNYSAYERFYCGWITPKLVNSACNITLAPTPDYDGAVIMTTTGEHNMDGVSPSPANFFLLENRQREGYDIYLPGHGMLITEIKYQKSSWNNNSVNTGSVSRVAIRPADGKTTQNGDGGDPYPGSKKVDSCFVVSGYPITDIVEDTKTNLITFKVLGGGEDIFLTSLTSTKDREYVIRNTPDGIAISNTAFGTPIAVYDFAGRLLNSAISVDEATNISINQRGLLIVKIGATAYTIMH